MQKKFSDLESSSKELIEKSIERLLVKYAGNENQVLNYLYGLEADAGVTYWDYINVDALLGLQHPRTKFSDEHIFIVYHQICELYFKLAINEIHLIQSSFIAEKSINTILWNKRLQRITTYFDKLINSFDVLSTDMLDTEEFYFFRMALLPASGFQTAQFREIEIMLTDLVNLTPTDEMLQAVGFDKADLPQSKYEQIYWKLAARDTVTKEKSQLLKNFEEKYDEPFQQLVSRQSEINIFKLFSSEQNASLKESVKEKMNNLQDKIIEWKGRHRAVIGGHFKYFNDVPYRDGKTLNQLHSWKIDPSKGTGDTNQREFLKMSISLKYFHSL